MTDAVAALEGMAVRKDISIALTINDMPSFRVEMWFSKCYLFCVHLYYVCLFCLVIIFLRKSVLKNVTPFAPQWNAS